MKKITPLKKTVILFFTAALLALNGMAQNCSASFTFSTNGNTVNFTNTSTGFSNMCIFYWNFGDNSYAYTANTSHTYTQPSVFYVCLTVYDSLSNCQSTYCDTITIVTSGIKNYENSLTVNVFPNPANETIYFNGSSSKYNYAIMDILGSTIYSGISTNNSIEIGALAQGTYIIQLTDDNGKMGTKRFIKK